jgi:hypothetical protein
MPRVGCTSGDESGSSVPGRVVGCRCGAWGGGNAFRGEGGNGPEDDTMLISSFGEYEVAVPGYTGGVLVGE